MLEVHHIYKNYEGRPLLNDISFQLKEGEAICLLGASGSGKYDFAADHCRIGDSRFRFCLIRWHGPDHGPGSPA